MTARAARREHVARRAPRVPFAVLVVGLIVGGLGLLLALNTASAANELRRHELAAKDSAIAARLQELRIEVAASAAPAKLAEAARAFGMVAANKPAFLVIGADGKIHVLGKPGAARPGFVLVPQTKKPTPAKTAKASTTPAKSAKSTSGAKPSRGAKPSTSAPSSPTPTPTPTPTVTLPGGDR